MRYKAVGKFQDFNVREFDGKKDPKKKFKAGQAIFLIDNSRTDQDSGEVFKLFHEVPFEIFGDKIIEVVQTLKFDDECEISFQLESNKGSEGKIFGKIAAKWIKLKNASSTPEPAPAKKDDDIPF